MGTRSQHAEAATNRVDLVVSHAAGAIGAARVGMCDQAERHLREALREHGRIIDNLEWVRAGKPPGKRDNSPAGNAASMSWGKSSDAVTEATQAVDQACRITRR